MKPEQIKKENIFKVPDKYFEQLPARIQSRIDEKKPIWVISFIRKPVFKIATPVLAVLLMIFYFSTNEPDNMPLNANEILAQVSSDDLIAYLETTDITTEEIIEELDFTDTDIDFDITEPMTQDDLLDENDINILLDEYGIEDELL